MNQGTCSLHELQTNVEIVHLLSNLIETHKKFGSKLKNKSEDKLVADVWDKIFIHLKKIEMIISTHLNDQNFGKKCSSDDCMELNQDATEELYMMRKDNKAYLELLKMVRKEL